MQAVADFTQWHVVDELAEYAHQVGRKDFEEFGRRIGLGNKLIKRELDEFVKEKPLVQVLIDRSFLSEELKK